MNTTTGLPLFDAVDLPPYRRHSRTSLSAAVRVAPVVSIRERKVLQVLLRGPATADEIATALGMAVLSIRPRVSELKHKLFVEPTGAVRPSVMGGDMDVVRLTESGIRAAKGVEAALAVAGHGAPEMRGLSGRVNATIGPKVTP